MGAGGDQGQHRSSSSSIQYPQQPYSRTAHRWGSSSSSGADSLSGAGCHDADGSVDDAAFTSNRPQKRSASSLSLSLVGAAGAKARAGSIDGFKPLRTLPQLEEICAEVLHDVAAAKRTKAALLSDDDADCNMVRDKITAFFGSFDTTKKALTSMLAISPTALLQFMKLKGEDGGRGSIAHIKLSLFLDKMPSGASKRPRLATAAGN